MKKLPVTLLIVLTLILSLRAIHAEKPPPPKSLAERVNMTTHVFVGKAKRVRVMELVDGRLVRVTPEPNNTGPGVVLELEVEIQEVLFPKTWKPPRVAKTIYSGGIVEIKKVREAFLAEGFVYLTREVSFNGQAYYVASYPWHLEEELDKREEIKSILERHVTR